MWLSWLLLGPSPCLPRWMSCLSNLSSASWLLLTTFCIFSPECTIHLSAHLSFSLPSKDDLTCGRSCLVTSSAPGHFEDVGLHFASVADFLFLLLCSECRAQVLYSVAAHPPDTCSSFTVRTWGSRKKIFTNTRRCL